VISSKDLMERTGLSRATLNNYIKRGLLSKPTIRSGESGASLLGYFPDATVDRIEAIQDLKAAGKSMTEIGRLLTGIPGAPDSNETSRGEAASRKSVDLRENRIFPSDGMGRKGDAAPLALTLEEVVFPAYMLNYRFELVWYNEAARAELLGGFLQLSASSDERNVLTMLRSGTEHWDARRSRELLRAHLSLSRARLSRETFLANTRHLPIGDQQFFRELFDESENVGHSPSLRIPLEVELGESGYGEYELNATYFREGMLIVYAPDRDASESLRGFLSRRDVLIRQLLKNRLPVLTPLAVLVADLQESNKICSELPAEEYFELINEIWSAMEPIFRRYAATRGKHVGEGRLYFFVPQAESSHIYNTLCCACELREIMREISARWQVRKKWVVELHLNLGLHEGTEWLGVFESANSIEFAVLGDLIQQAQRVSELARYGSIWATKNMIAKLSPEELRCVQYGVKRRGWENREIFVENTFAQVESLVNLDSHPKMRDVATLAVTEVVALTWGDTG